MNHKVVDRKFVVGWYEGSGEQVTVDLDKGEVVGVRKSGIVQFYNGERVRIGDDGRIAGPA